MKISSELISQLSTLAKLEFKEGDFFAIKKDLKKILAFIKILDKLDVSDVEPLSHISTEINVLREDLIIDYKCKKSSMTNSPIKDSDYFKVKKVIKKLDKR